MNTIANRLKFVRGSLSREEFSEIIGIHKNTVGRYERGESEPDLTIASKICSEFDIDPRWLMLGEGPQPVISSFRHKTEFDMDKKKTRFVSTVRNGKDIATNENVELLAEIVLNMIKEKEIPLVENSALAVAYFFYPEMKLRIQHFAREFNKLSELKINDSNSSASQVFNQRKITNVAGRDVNNDTSKKR